jgi:hypothetical protein
MTDATVIYLLFFILYLAICGGLGVYVATEKNRGGIEGFCFGMFLGPLGVIAVGTLPTLEPAPLLDEIGQERHKLETNGAWARKLLGDDHCPLGTDIGKRIIDKYNPANR